MISSVSALLPANRRGVRFAALAALCLFGLSACSTFAKDEEDPIVITDEPADKLYNEGLYLLNNGNYEKSSEKFKQLDQQHPYTEWARKAHLMEVYAHYKQGNYDDAAISGKRYLALHPGSEDAAYAQYLVAMSNYNQIPDVTRDQKRTQEALQALDEVVRKWPDSEYAGEARKRIAVARDQLAGKEMEIGRYYLKERQLDRRDQPLQDRRHPASDHAPRGRGAGPPGGGLYEPRHRRRGADRRRRARPQLPAEPVVQGYLQAHELQGTGAA